MKKAVEFYDQALAIDPNYAADYAALAVCYLFLGQNAFEDPGEMMRKSQFAAQRALELDENLADVHLAMAGVRRVEWNWTEAEHEYKRAIELNRNLSLVHFAYSFFLTTQGRHEEAAAEIRLGRDLDPLRSKINLEIAYGLYFSRQYDLAIEQYEIGLELDPSYGGGYYGRGLVYTAQGRYKEAIADYKEMLRLNGDHAGVYCYLGAALAKDGQLSEAKAILRRLETGKEYVSPVELAVLYVGLGERETALAALERAYDKRDSQMQYLVIEPNFNSLRSEPRFASLVQKVGLPA